MSVSDVGGLGAMNRRPALGAGQILTGPLFNEPMRVETVPADGPAPWVVDLAGANSERFRKVTLTAGDLERLAILDPQPSFAGDGRLPRRGLQAYALDLAYEFDPYFGLSISRVDPLPHQLEAVYDYLLKLARVPFLLADDAGAGKTVMAGLLIRELELRGLAERTGGARRSTCAAPRKRWCTSPSDRRDGVVGVRVGGEAQAERDEREGRVTDHAGGESRALVGRTALAGHRAANSAV